MPKKKEEVCYLIFQSVGFIPKCVICDLAEMFALLQKKKSVLFHEILASGRI